jgi:hypothetical protein
MELGVPQTLPVVVVVLVVCSVLVVDTATSSTKVNTTIRYKSFLAVLTETDDTNHHANRLILYVECVWVWIFLELIPEYGSLILLF